MCIYIIMVNGLFFAVKDSKNDSKSTA